MLSILYGLISAITWGAADFTGGLASRRSTSEQVVAITWLFGLVVLPVAALLSGEKMMPLAGWIWCAVGGAFGVIGILILYKMMAEGNMSTAVSISAVTAGALPVLVGIVLDGPPKILKIVGFILALTSVWLITMGHNLRGKFRLKDTGLPLIAGACFGMYFILVNQGSQDYIFWPMVATRFMGGLILIAYMLSNRRSWLPPRNVYWLLALNFVLDTLGTAAYILAGQVGRMDVAAVLGSLYPGMTILLAWLVLHEEMNWLQWTGIGLALSAILLFSI